MKWINKASEDKSTRICWVYNDKGCGSKKAKFICDRSRWSVV